MIVARAITRNRINLRGIRTFEIEENWQKATFARVTYCLATPITPHASRPPAFPTG